MIKQSEEAPLNCGSFQRQEDELSQASSNEVYQPNRNPRRKKLCHKNIKKRIKIGWFNSSLWTLAQNQLYKKFLIENSKFFDQNRQGRKILKINVLMSKLIKTRSADQCRSHHQKMMKYHRSIPEIVAHIEELQKERTSLKSQESEADSIQEQLIKPELIDLNDCECKLQFLPEERDLIEMFLTFSS